MEELSIARLRQYPFLQVLGDTILNKIRPHLAEKRFAAGEQLLRLGDYSDAAYYLAEGEVSVHVPRAVRPSADQRRQTAASGRPARRDTNAAASRSGLSIETVSLAPGDIFGEIGALSRYPVTADVFAATDVAVLMIATPGLRLLLKQRELIAFRQSIDDRYRSRTLASHLRRVELFEAFDDASIERLRDVAELLAFDPGAVIAREGEVPDGFYLVRGGHVRISGGPRQHTLSYLRKGDYAGELGLLDHQPWPYSLSAIEHVEIVRLPSPAVAAVLEAFPDVAVRLRADASLRAESVARAIAEPAAAGFVQTAVDTGLINGQSVLLIDMQRCTGCDDCVQACADTHAGVPRLIRQGATYSGWTVPVACYQCSDPVCMIGCPTGAITRPLGGIEVTIDAGSCIGCGNCVRRCPWGNIITVPYESELAGRQIELATKCDLCVGRRDGPACVQMCPHGAATRISFQDPGALADMFTRGRRPS